MTAKEKEQIKREREDTIAVLQGISDWVASQDGSPEAMEKALTIIGGLAADRLAYLRKKA